MTHQAKHVLVYCAVCIRLQGRARIRHLRRSLVGLGTFQLANDFIVARSVGLLIGLFHSF